ncbi:MAG: 50S ribosomal protein L24 [Candidatus Paceibacterota bacterium]|jgi:large subunit ribosomal protein L24
MHVKKGDKVIVLTGKDAGKTGEVVRAFPKKDKVIVAGVNKMKRHMRPTKSGQKGQTVEKEMPLHISNVALAKESKK